MMEHLHAEMAADAEAEEVVADRAPSDDMMATAERFAQLKDELDEAKARTKELQAEYDTIRKETLPEAMRAAGIVSSSGKGSFTLSDGRRIFLRNDLYPNVRKANERDFVAWLKEKGHGDIVKESVHFQTLRAFVREQMENGAELPEYVGTYTETTASIRKA